MCGTCPSMRVPYLMSICNNKWDIVVPDSFLLSVLPDCSTRLALFDLCSDLFCPITSFRVVLDRPLQQ